MCSSSVVTDQRARPQWKLRSVHCKIKRKARRLEVTSRSICMVRRKWKSFSSVQVELNTVSTNVNGNSKTNCKVEHHPITLDKWWKLKYQDSVRYTFVLNSVLLIVWLEQVVLELLIRANDLPQQIWKPVCSNVKKTRTQTEKSHVMWLMKLKHSKKNSLNVTYLLVLSRNQGQWSKCDK